MERGTLKNTRYETLTEKSNQMYIWRIRTILIEHNGMNRTVHSTHTIHTPGIDLVVERYIRTRKRVQKDT